MSMRLFSPMIALLVLIAVNRYEEWPNLQYPVSDVGHIRDVLQRRYYVDEVVELCDGQATKENIMRTFIELQQRVETHDSVLIYYSGHAHLRDLGFVFLGEPA